MPPKVRFTKDEIIDAAFEIAREKGFSAVTARSVSGRLNCSVAPIYVNFEAIEDLISAVVNKVFSLSNNLLAQQSGENLFENIGKASLAFAREYPVFFRELVMNPNPWLSHHEAIKDELVEALADDPEMGKLPFEQRKRLLLKMQIFQTGLSAMVASSHVPEWLNDRQVEDLLMQTGDELLFASLHMKKGDTVQ